MSAYEFEIPVPWGQISAKAWGDSNNPIVLVFHGIIDNAGSFDRLIPLLPNKFYYICFDLPSHGRSSHFPEFLPIHTINYVIAYKLLALHFKQERYIIMGHSYGAQLAFKFAQLYPEFVEKLIMLDTVHLFPVPSHIFQSFLRDRLDFVITLNEKKKTREAPTYTLDQALKKMIDSRFNGYISVDAAKALLPRAVKPAEDGKFRFTVDQRLKNVINPMHDFRYIAETVKKFPLRCPVLIILGRSSDLQQLYFKRLISEYRKFKNIRIRIVEGHHDVHNNEPESVAPHIIRFLEHKTPMKAKL